MVNTANERGTAATFKSLKLRGKRATHSKKKNMSRLVVCTDTNVARNETLTQCKGFHFFWSRARKTWRCVRTSNVSCTANTRFEHCRPKWNLRENSEQSLFNRNSSKNTFRPQKLLTSIFSNISHSYCSSVWLDSTKEDSVVKRCHYLRKFSKTKQLIIIQLTRQVRLLRWQVTRRIKWRKFTVPWTGSVAKSPNSQKNIF